MHKLLLILLLTLPAGCYYNPTPGPAPQPVVPDLEGISLEAYEHATEADAEPGEVSRMIVVLGLTVSQAGALSWGVDEINDYYLTNNRALFTGDSTAESRWGAYFKWQKSAIGKTTEPAELIVIFKQIIKGLEAVHD